MVAYNWKLVKKRISFLWKKTKERVPFCEMAQLQKDNEERRTKHWSETRGPL